MPLGVVAGLELFRFLGIRQTAVRVGINCSPVNRAGPEPEFETYVGVGTNCSPVNRARGVLGLAVLARTSRDRLPVPGSNNSSTVLIERRLD